MFDDLKMHKSDDKLSDRFSPVKKVNRRKNCGPAGSRKPNPGVKLAVRLNFSDSESTSLHDDEQRVPQGGLLLGQTLISTTEKLPFSELMRKMAKKYQDKDEDVKEEQQM